MYDLKNTTLSKKVFLKKNHSILSFIGIQKPPSFKVRDTQTYVNWAVHSFNTPEWGPEKGVKWD